MKYNVDKICDISTHQRGYIRNVSIISDFGHGKSTLRDILVGASVVTSKFGNHSNLKHNNTTGDNSITTCNSIGSISSIDGIDSIDGSSSSGSSGCNVGGDNDRSKFQVKTSTVSLLFENINFVEFDKLVSNVGDTTNTTSYRSNNGSSMMSNSDPLSKTDKCLIHLMDCPGYIDFTSQVVESLRLMDGALIIVDVVEGFTVQTELLIRQAMMECIKPVLVINKLDRAIIEIEMKPEDLYQSISCIIEKINDVISTYDFDGMGQMFLDPRRGNVCFGSGKMGWYFSLKTFANLYAPKFKR